MTNQEVADELQYAMDLIKQDGKDWLDERDIPILEAAISALQEQEAKHSTESSLTQKALDTISRTAAIDAVESFGILDGYADQQELIYRIRQLPSAQPEIVRCKDCIKREICRTSTTWAVAPKDDWYCADAERRTDG